MHRHGEVRDLISLGGSLVNELNVRVQTVKAGEVLSAPPSHVQLLQIQANRLAKTTNIARSWYVDVLGNGIFYKKKISLLRSLCWPKRAGEVL